MAKMNEMAWEDFLESVLNSDISRPFPSQTQLSNQVVLPPLPNSGDSHGHQDWFLNAAANQAQVEQTNASTQQPNAHHAPSESLLTTSTHLPHFISPYELITVIQGMKDRIGGLEKMEREELKENHQKLLTWTLEMQKSVLRLAQKALEDKARKDGDQWGTNE